MHRRLPPPYLKNMTDGAASLYCKRLVCRNKEDIMVKKIWLCCVVGCVGGMALCASSVCKKRERKQKASAPVLTGTEAILWGPDTPEKEKLLWDLSINIVTQNL